jgi:peptidoglycan biosynthesis protein MviN/MurJ (putative lipid II flippase)
MIAFYLFTSITALAAYFYLIPRYSYIGAAAVTIYSEVLIALFSAYCVFKYVHFLPNLKISLKSLLASLVMGIFLYFSADYANQGIGQLILIILIACALYFIFLYLIGGIKSADLKSIFKKQSKGGGQSYSPGINL